MELACYYPRHTLAHRRHTTGLFDGLFDEILTPSFSLGRLAGEAASALKVDVFEKDEAIVIEAEIPGVSKEDIKLDVKGRFITLSGERKSNEEVQEGKCYRREIRYGTFERTFSMPFEIDASQVVAKYDQGILRLTIARPAEQQKKQIEIQ